MVAISQSNLPQFIAKLYSILSDPRYQSYIRWSQDGRSFIIIDPTEFCSGVLSEHFKHSNMSSFVRQLNKYDFHKMKSDESTKMQYGTGMWEFAHKYFRRDRMDLIGQITRKPSAVEQGAVRGHERYSEQQDGEYNSVFYSYVMNTMSNITKYFEMISEDLKQIRLSIPERSPAAEQMLLRALIAEDNASCAKYAASIFKKNSFIPVLAESVNELNYCLSNSNFEMILLSNGIPDVFEIIKNIRAKNPTTPIVLTVDDSSKIDSDVIHYRGVDRVLTKPFLHESLVNAIRQRHVYRSLRSDQEQNQLRANMHYPLE